VYGVYNLELKPSNRYQHDGFSAVAFGPESIYIYIARARGAKPVDTNRFGNSSFHVVYTAILLV